MIHYAFEKAMFQSMETKLTIHKVLFATNIYYKLNIYVFMVYIVYVFVRCLNEGYFECNLQEYNPVSWMSIQLFAMLSGAAIDKSHLVLILSAIF